MRSFSARLQFGNAGFGFGLLRVFKGGDGSPSHIADGPDHTHSRTGDGFGPEGWRLRAITGTPPATGIGWRVQATRFGGFCRCA